MDSSSSSSSSSSSNSSSGCSSSSLLTTLVQTNKHIIESVKTVSLLMRVLKYYVQNKARLETWK